MIYSVRRFSDDDNKGGMGWGTKAAIGAAGLAAAFGAGKAGLLGAGLQRTTNKMWLNAGSALGSRGMMNSGLKGINKANVSTATKDFLKQNKMKAADLTKEQTATIRSSASAKTKEMAGDKINQLRDLNKTWGKTDAANAVREANLKSVQEATAKTNSTANLAGSNPGFQSTPSNVTYVYG